MTTEKPYLKIDFVSDVACPWCAIGLASLERALERTGDVVEADVYFQPFELNPDMGPEGADTSEYLSAKYGSTPEQQARMRAAMRERGAALGFEFRADGRPRIHNTFDAHRLILWAREAGGEEGGARQRALKKHLLAAYHGQGRNPASREVLLEAAAAVGLDVEAAAAVIDSDVGAKDVREVESYYQAAGISGVPAIIFNDRHLISGGQPPEVFEQAIRQLVGQGSDAS